jgi:hypothetical protein
MAEQQRKQVELSRWKNFSHELKKRTVQPLEQPTFVFYFVVVIVIVGGLGVLIKVPKAIGAGATSQDVLAVAKDLSTYLLAMIAAAFVDLNFSESAKQPSLRMFALSLSIIGAICAVYSNFTSNSGRACYIALFGTVLALFLWWIANFDNAKLLEPLPAPTAATGGDTDQIAGENKNVKF